jgi:hypothetical protein
MAEGLDAVNAAVEDVRSTDAELELVRDRAVDARRAPARAMEAGRVDVDQRSPPGEEEEGPTNAP